MKISDLQIQTASKEADALAKKLKAKGIKVIEIHYPEDETVDPMVEVEGGFFVQIGMDGGLSVTDKDDRFYLTETFSKTVKLIKGAQ